jgi:protein NUD1
MYACRLIPLSIGIDDKSPLRPTNLAHPAAGTLLPGVKHGLGTDDTSDTRVPISDIARRVPSRSHSVTVGVGSQPNATFLTEASFGVAHDKLVQVITDLQPFEPYWEELSSIDLANKNIESVARLKEFLPQLHTLSL